MAHSSRRRLALCYLDTNCTAAQRSCSNQEARPRWCRNAGHIQRSTIDRVRHKCPITIVDDRQVTVVNVVLRERAVVTHELSSTQA